MGEILTKKEYDITIEHWENMINWVKKQDPKEIVSMGNMSWEIGENWQGYHCHLCSKYYTDIHCSNCPIAIHEQCCNMPNSYWRKINDTFRNNGTWKEWLEAAEKFLEWFKTLPKEKEEK